MPLTPEQIEENEDNQYLSNITEGKPAPAPVDYPWIQDAPKDADAKYSGKNSSGAEGANSLQGKSATNEGRESLREKGQLPGQQFGPSTDPVDSQSSGRDFGQQKSSAGFHGGDLGTAGSSQSSGYSQAVDAHMDAFDKAADEGFGHGTKVNGGVRKGYADTAGNPAQPFYDPPKSSGGGHSGGRSEPQGGTSSHSLTVGAPAKPAPVKTAETPSSAVTVERGGSSGHSGGGGGSSGGGASAGGGGGGGGGGGSSGGGAPPSGKPSELLQSSWQLIFQVPGSPITLCDFDDILDGPVTFSPSRNSQSEQFVGSTTGAVYDRGNKMTEIHFERWVMFDTVEEALNSVLLTSVQIPNGSWPLTITVQGQSVFTVANCVIVSYPSSIWNNLCRTSYTLRGGELTEGAIITAEDGTELTTEDGSTLITES